jgi:hypothetical protein
MVTKRQMPIVVEMLAILSRSSALLRDFRFAGMSGNLNVARMIDYGIHCPSLVQAVLLIVYIVHIWLKICHMVLYCIRNIDIV